MERYTYIHSRIWLDDKFVSLDSDSKMLFLYLMTSPHCNMIGYYRLPLLYAAADLGQDPGTIKVAFNTLLEAGLVKYDERQSIVLIPNYLRYNRLQNQNQAKGACALAEKLPQNELMGDFLACVAEHAGDLAENFAHLVGAETVTETVTQTLSVGLPKPLPQGLPHIQSTEYRVQSTDKHIPSSADDSASAAGDDLTDCHEDEPPDDGRSRAATVVPLSDKVCSRLFEHWNGAGAIVHKALTKDMVRAIKRALREHNEEQICLAMDRYAAALHDESYFYEHRWTLEKFLKQKNGLPEWLDDGQQWVNYQSRGRPARAPDSKKTAEINPYDNLW